MFSESTCCAFFLTNDFRWSLDLCEPPAQPQYMSFASAGRFLQRTSTDVELSSMLDHMHLDKFSPSTPCVQPVESYDDDMMLTDSDTEMSSPISDSSLLFPSWSLNSSHSRAGTPVSDHECPGTAFPRPGTPFPHGNSRDFDVVPHHRSTPSGRKTKRSSPYNTPRHGRSRSDLDELELLNIIAPPPPPTSRPPRHARFPAFMKVGNAVPFSNAQKRTKKVRLAT
jgi:hypothetical protein